MDRRRGKAEVIGTFSDYGKAPKSRYCLNLSKNKEKKEKMSNKEH